MTSDTFGLTSLSPLMRFDLDSASWRTCADTCLWDLEMSSPTFPEWGTMRAGVLYELPTPERRTVEQESLLLRNSEIKLLLTPCVADNTYTDNPSRFHNGERFGLQDQIAALLPTPTAQAAKHGASPDVTANSFGSNLWDLPHLLPTPTPFTNSNSESPDEWLLRRKDVIERTGTHHGLPLAVAAASVAAGKPISQKDPMSSLDDWSDETASVNAEVNWGKYGAAIDRWAGILDRPSPDPTIPNAAGRPRLSPSFVEWMMGLPAGHVTGHGLRPAQELKMLGNGVCPQQAELALRMITAQ